MAKAYVNDEMIIGDILSKLPEAAEIMESYGLHCTSCSVNAFEPVKAGAMAHGIPEKTVDKMISEINKLADKRPKAPTDGIYITERAARKIKEFAAAEDKSGWGLKITAEDNNGKEPAYIMDFQEKAKKSEKAFSFHGVEIYLDKNSLKNMLGSEVDFIETQYGSGFKIENPAFNQSACGCGSGKCGDGGCGCA